MSLVATGLAAPSVASIAPAASTAANVPSAEASASTPVAPSTGRSTVSTGIAPSTTNASSTVSTVRATIPRAAQDYTLAPGFAIEKACELEQSLIALTFAPRVAGSTAQRMFLSVENGPILVATDADGDGNFETQTTFTTEVTNAQGLVCHKGALFAVGTRGDAGGIYRIGIASDGASAGAIERLVPIVGSIEHGAHGIAVGPDGYLYVALGNEAAITTPPHPSSPLLTGNEGSLLPPLYDQNGFNVACRYPGGAIARVDSKNGSWIYHSVGYRNHYDIAFDADGELFTCDSDMEWDLGLPWYRPVRVLHCTSGTDYGARAGTAMWRSYYPDTVPDVAVVGRGSPTGVAIYGGAQFPPRLHGSLLVGDWSQDRILAVRLKPRGASFTGEIETLVEMRNTSGVTDLVVAPDGSVYFTTGGRGALGELRRLTYHTPTEEPRDKAPATSAATGADAAKPTIAASVAPADASVSPETSTAMDASKSATSEDSSKPAASGDSSKTATSGESSKSESSAETSKSRTSEDSSKPAPGAATDTARASAASSDADRATVATPLPVTARATAAHPLTPRDPNVESAITVLVHADLGAQLASQSALASEVRYAVVCATLGLAVDDLRLESALAMRSNSASSAASAHDATPSAEPSPAADAQPANDAAGAASAVSQPNASATSAPASVTRATAPPKKLVPGRRATLDELKRRLTDADARSCRRACEELVTLATLEPDIRERLYALLGSPDPYLRQAARGALERTASKDLFVRLEFEKDPVRVLETVLLLARSRVLDVPADALLEQLGRRAATPWGVTHAMDVARAFEIVLLSVGNKSGGTISAERSDKLAALCLANFPAADPRASRELAVLLAHWNPPGAIDCMLDALQNETDREQAIHYAFCLASIEPIESGQSGWTVERASRWIAWFESTSGWSGGASFAGYLDAMQRRFLQHLPTNVRRAIVREDKLGLGTLAALLVETVGADVDAHSAPASEFFEALKAEYAKLGTEPRDLETKKSVLRTVGGCHVRGLPAWLRMIALSDAPERSEAMMAFARLRRPTDQAVLLKGLASTELEVPEACAEALCAIDKRSDAAADWAAVLDNAYRLGAPRGWALLRVVNRWLQKPYLVPKPEEWTRTLQQFDSLFAVKFPSYERAPRPEAERPHWDHERVLAFLQKSSARPGSAARGEEVFKKASCTTCHVYFTAEGSSEPVIPPGAGSQWGPDLSTVGRRFDVVQLLENIDFPSRYISDQYRTSVVELTDEERVDGRIVEQDAESLTLLASDGTRRPIARSEVKSISPSAVSAMPEGLLSALTLEEIKDLVTFLRSEGKVEPSDAAGAPWTPLFAGSQRTNWSYDANAWRLKTDVLVGHGDGLAQSSYVVSKSSYRDFEVEFDVFLRNGNSGFQYRSKIDPEKPDPVGYQADIGQGYWGSLYASDGRNTLAKPEPEVWSSAVDRGGWNHFFVRVEGDHHHIEINGITTVDAQDAVHTTGIIGFQVHEGMKMEVRFANMRIRTLDPR